MSGIPLRSIRDYWANVLDKFPRKTALIAGGRSWTYAEADAEIASLRLFLHDRVGFGPQETALTVLPNCAAYFHVYWAIINSGGVVMPVNTRLQADEMAYIANYSDARVLFVHRALWPVAEKAIQNNDRIEHIVFIGADGEVPESPGRRTYDYKTLISVEPRELPSPDIAPEDLAVVMHTSGTTGRPKGAMVTHDNLIFNVKNSIIAHSMRHEDVHLLVTPMFHCTALYSMLPGSAYLGSTVLICPKPDVRDILQLIEEHRATTFLAVPTLLYFVVTFKDLASFDTSSLRLIGYAGSPMPVETIRKLRKAFPHVELHNFFGLTETISVTHVLPDCDAETHPDSIGKLLPEVAQRIVDDNGQDVAIGEVGELCFHKENVVKGYWKRPGLLEEAMIGDWFRTGDYAFADEEGFVYLRGRKKDMIIVGGENVYALEVESVLLSHEKVMEAAVVGVPATGIRAYLGELVKAVVAPKPGQTLTELEIKRHCAERLPSYKRPHIVQIVEKLPRNPSGKVLKRLLKET